MPCAYGVPIISTPPHATSLHLQPQISRCHARRSARNGLALRPFRPNHSVAAALSKRQLVLTAQSLGGNGSPFYGAMATGRPDPTPRGRTHDGEETPRTCASSASTTTTPAEPPPTSSPRHRHRRARPRQPARAPPSTALIFFRPGSRSTAIFTSIQLACLLLQAAGRRSRSDHLSVPRHLLRLSSLYQPPFPSPTPPASLPRQPPSHATAPHRLPPPVRQAERRRLGASSRPPASNAAATAFLPTSPPSRTAALSRHRSAATHAVACQPPPARARTHVIRGTRGSRAVRKNRERGEEKGEEWVTDKVGPTDF
ncbi:hypothetical protein DAI22_02g142200 [Oryza sativa Japonica Group]|nr:hypothetical protein DAI22_02g142200 [Oryza sativa Japonica Group]